jgi:two-component system cell cycle sensor histidine kinase/response regulator CckA
VQSHPHEAPIVVVEDEPAHAEAVRRSLGRAGRSVIVVSTLAEYRGLVAAVVPQIVLSDLNLPDGSALELFGEAPRWPLLLMTSHGDEAVAVQAMKAGALDYIVKSDFAFVEMPRTVERALREWSNLQQARKAEHALRQSERRFSTIFQASPVPIIVSRLKDGVIVDVNESCLSLLGFGRGELIGKAWAELTDNGELVTAVLTAEPSVGERHGTARELRIKTHQGEHRCMLASLERIDLDGVDCTLAILFDLTERKQAEEQRLEMERRMLHVQKLESLGVMAGGVAHDFNNILVAILGHADMAIEDLPPTSPACESLFGIKQAAMRAAELSQQILAYSGRGKYTVGAVNLNDIVTELTRLLAATMSKRARLELVLAESLPAIEGDATQLRQVAMNLITNASEALGEQDGDITVTTGCCNCAQDYLERLAPAAQLAAGDYVFLEVRDSGCGMDAATIARVFEPFFTTKFTGRGLGMAAVLGIVKSHGGAVSIDSKPGVGTVFRVVLPARKGTLVADGPSPCPEDWKGSGRVLLVDDEEMVRKVGGRMLRSLGFEVEEVRDGLEALARYAAASFDCVVLDLTMPLMDGAQTLLGLRSLDPTVTVVLSSGYAEAELSRRFAGEGDLAFIQKPYSLTALRRSMQEAMCRRPAAAGSSAGAAAIGHVPDDKQGDLRASRAGSRLKPPSST